jgi:uncharacterized metal-binding protein YceD (DUF177 family)
LKVSIDDLRSLSQSRLGISFKEDIAGLDAIKPVVGELTVAASSTGMHLSGRVQTLLKLNCDNCLRPYFQSLTVDIDERFVVAELDKAAGGARERELSASDFVEALPADGSLDITDVVYQAVTLATPSHCTCGEQCPGPQMPHAAKKAGSLRGNKKSAAESDRVDPRWKNLKSLFPKEET